MLSKGNPGEHKLAMKYSADRNDQNSKIVCKMSEAEKSINNWASCGNRYLNPINRNTS